MKKQFLIVIISLLFINSAIAGSRSPVVNDMTSSLTSYNKIKVQARQKSQISQHQNNEFYTAQCGTYKYLTDATADRIRLQKKLGNKNPVFLKKDKAFYLLYVGRSLSKSYIESLITSNTCKLVRLPESSVSKKENRQNQIKKHYVKTIKAIHRRYRYIKHRYNKRKYKRHIRQIAIRLPAVQRHIQVIKYSKGYTMVNISLKDVNRIVAPDKVVYVIHSKEKDMQVKKLGKSVYVKIMPVQQQNPSGINKLKYGNEDRDLFIITNSTYSLILVPKNIPAQTIYLKDHRVIENIGKVSKTSSKYVKNIENLLRQVYQNEIPAGFGQNKSGKLIKKYKQADIILNSIYTGIPYNIYSYTIVAKQPIRITESQFVNLADHPIAIAIVRHNLLKYQAGKIFIIAATPEAEYAN